jgi:hypothetical protein
LAACRRRSSRPWKSRRGRTWVDMGPLCTKGPELSLYYARFSNGDCVVSMIGFWPGTTALGEQSSSHLKPKRPTVTHTKRMPFRTADRRERALSCTPKACKLFTSQGQTARSARRGALGAALGASKGSLATPRWVTCGEQSRVISPERRRDPVAQPDQSRNRFGTIVTGAK